MIINHLLPFVQLIMDYDLQSLQLQSTNLENVEYVRPDPTYVCISCCNCLVDPLQLQCGHRMCRGCYERLFRTAETRFDCPSGEGECVESVAHEVTPDYFVRRELGRKEVYCVNRNVGCLETPLLRLLKKHLDEDCLFTTVECPYKCGLAVIVRNELEKHKELCPNRPQSCHFSAVGCNFEGSVELLEDHLHREPNLHLEKVAIKLFQYEVENIDLRRELEQLTEKCDSLDGCMKDMKSKIESTTGLALSLISRINFNQIDSKMVEKLNQEADASFYGSLKTDVQRRVENHSEILQRHKFTLNELELKLQCFETTNYKGILVWKINGFNSRLSEAKSGKTLSLYSQPFYTSRYGYKMCARVYLNGDGIGKNHFISYFFVIMRGDYDDILAWPFRQKVTLMLLDQKSSVRNITESFQPDPSSTSFKKPTTPMNVASGSPKFISHGELEKNDFYLRNDTLFFKIIVDIKDL